MKRILLTVPIILLAIAHSGCNGNGAEKPEQKRSDTLVPLKKVVTDASIPGNFSAQTVLKFDSTEIGKFMQKYPEFRNFRKELERFYSNRSYAYAWFDEGGLIEPSMDLYYRIVNITDEGIPLHVPYLPEYRKMVEGDEKTDPQSTRTPEMELMITAQYFHYAKDAWGGISESQSQQDEWYIPRKKIAYDQLLDSMLTNVNGGKELKEPVHRQYTLLKGYLKRFREIEKKGTWFPVRADRKKYEKGDTGRAVADIRKKLFLAGELAADNGSRTYDDEMVNAVKKYQLRYGMKEDGVAGPALLREMNTPLSVRIQQIVVNMERARWIGSDPVGEHLVVNIPQFQLMVYDERDSLSWSCRVVVGKEANKTAIFQGNLKYIVFSPYWNVPSSILNKEILPAIRRNPNYLRAHNMEWNGKGVRQKPGGNNSLGRVKFLFPNSFSMYLHDTPSKSLFEEDSRAFSHGCIRVSEPRRLALHLLRNEPEWTEEKVDAAMNSEREQYVTVRKPLPVTIVYFTAWVDGQGRINFRDDIYKRDARLMDMIFSKK
jgi:murein L,D-transpeptidase YcbB/YkuD